MLRLWSTHWKSTTSWRRRDTLNIIIYNIVVLSNKLYIWYYYITAILQYYITLILQYRIKCNWTFLTRKFQCFSLSGKFRYSSVPLSCVISRYFKNLDRQASKIIQKTFETLTFRPLEEDSYEGTKVSGGICEREIVSRETTTRNVLNSAHVLNVSGIFTRTWHPHGIQSVGVFLLFDVLLKIGWHGARQVFRVVVIFRFPAENLKSLPTVDQFRLVSKVSWQTFFLSFSFFSFFFFFFFFVSRTLFNLRKMQGADLL